MSQETHEQQLMYVEPMFYIGAPYSHPDPQIVDMRMELLSIADAKMLGDGLLTVTPLDKHSSVKKHSMPGDWKFWQRYSLSLLSLCQGMIVVQLPGWDTSEGLSAERRFAQASGKKICMLTHHDIMTMTPAYLSVLADIKQERESNQAIMRSLNSIR